MRSLIAFGVVLSLTGWNRPARACPPSVRLSGDHALVEEIGPVLVDRGIATASDDCPAIAVALARRGKLTIVSSTEGDHPTERAVSDPRTAATVIESWVRTDVEAPLLEPRRQDDGDARVPALVPTIAATVPPAPTRDVQLFTVAERSLASDGTGWFGLQLGACIMFGPLCGSAQVRLDAVTDGPGRWSGLDRHGAEVLLGADWPLRLGRATLSPGLAVGLGWMHTHEESSPTGEETGGLRAESHLGLSYPVSARLAVELALSAEVTQATHVESSSLEPLPSEPRFLSRLGLGVRFEGL